MLDILVVGVTLQRGASVPALGSDSTVELDEVAPGSSVMGARRKAPGVSVAGALAHLTPPIR
jgi:hypothetical protein